MNGSSCTFAWEGTPEVLVLRVDCLEICRCSFEGRVVRWTLDRECETVDPLLWKGLLYMQKWGTGANIHVRVCSRRGE